MTAYQIYYLFNCVLLHFKGSYDYHKNSGRIKNFTKSKFLKDSSYPIYMMLESKKIRRRRLLALFISAIVYRNKKHISFVYDGEGQELAKMLEAKWDSLTYKFTEDCKYLLSKYKLKELYQIPSGETLPPLIQEMVHSNIHMETVCIFHKHVKSIDMETSDEILYPILKTKVERYSPFLNTNDNTIKKIIVDLVKQK